jgi:hypothetical protein
LGNPYDPLGDGGYYRREEQERDRREAERKKQFWAILAECGSDKTTKATGIRIGPFAARSEDSSTYRDQPAPMNVLGRLCTIGRNNRHIGAMSAMTQCEEGAY